MSVPLFSRTLGNPASPRVVVAHGLAGSSRNWLSMGELLSRDFYVTLLDLRDHGASPWTEELSYPAMAEDVIEWWKAQGMPEFSFIGHSMGGKLGLVLATQYKELLENKLQKLVVVDIAPKLYQPTYQYAFQACIDMDLSGVASRKQADEILTKTVTNNSFRTFLLTNLAHDEAGTYRWVCHWEQMLADLPQLAANPLADNDLYNGPSLFIAGERSDFIKPDDKPLILKYFPHARLEFLPAGHNVHTDVPSEFYQLVGEFLHQSS